jgi:hypothetical protein
MDMMDVDPPTYGPFQRLSADIIRNIVVLLDPNDITNLAVTCRSLKWIAKDNLIWQQKYLNTFDHLIVVRDLLNEAGLSAKYLSVEQPWYERFMKRYYYNEDDTKQEEDEKQVSTMLVSVHENLRSFQMDPKSELLDESVNQLVYILDIYPEHPDAYYLFGVLCFMINAFHPALEFLEICEKIDSDYKLVHELKEEIQTLLNQLEGNDNEAALLEGKELSTKLRNVLAEIFTSFDLDRDQHLSLSELDAFIYKTNGQHAPTSFLKQFIQHYGMNRGRLTLDGFLSFYLEQTLNDPMETRKDLDKHGFDMHTLESKHYKAGRVEALLK